MRTSDVRPAAAIAALAGLLCLGALAYGAWVCDDAAITVRVLDNCAHGLGLRWNPAERVQVFTHPLWAILLLAAHQVTHEFFDTLIGLGIALSVLAMSVLAFRVAPGARAAALGLAALAASRAFSEYSTAGLENPLAHVLLLCFAAAFVKPGPLAPRAGRLGVLAGLLATNRADASLLVLPALALVCVEARRAGAFGRTLRAIAAGFLPFALWVAFAWFYFGSWAPNPALAKLATGLGPAQLVPRGLAYLENSVRFDPATLLATALGILLPGVRGDRRAAALGAGALLGLGWVVSIGGDFMSGRFLTPPLVLAVAALAGAPPAARVAWVLVAVFLALAALPPFSPFAERRPGPSWDAAIDAHGIADERAFYGRASLRRERRGPSPWPQPRRAAEARGLRSRWNHDPLVRELHAAGVLETGWPPSDSLAAHLHPVVIRDAVGFLGYYLGPDVHVLDRHGLCDPLLARQPALVPDPVLVLTMPRLRALGWRTGHFTRRIPDGYPETLATGVDRLRDPAVAREWERLALLTRAPLFSQARLRALVGLPVR